MFKIIKKVITIKISKYWLIIINNDVFMYNCFSIIKFFSFFTFWSFLRCICSMHFINCINLFIIYLFFGCFLWSSSLWLYLSYLFMSMVQWWVINDKLSLLFWFSDCCNVGRCMFSIILGTLIFYRIYEYWSAPRSFHGLSFSFYLFYVNLSLCR